MNDYEQMIISALRYSLPRRSYIMLCTDDYISNMIKGDVSKHFIALCIEDIKGHYRDVERGLISDGLHDWKPLMDKLVDKLDNMTNKEELREKLSQMISDTVWEVTDGGQKIDSKRFLTYQDEPVRSFEDIVDFFWKEIQKREEELIQKIEIMKPHCLGLTDSCLVTKKQVLDLIKSKNGYVDKSKDINK